MRADSKTVVYINSHRLGQDEPELGAALMQGFVGLIKDMPIIPGYILLVNSAVFLSTRDPKSIEALSFLQNECGTEVLSCTTCLEHFKIMDQLKVGEASSAPVIMKAMFAAERLIRP